MQNPDYKIITLDADNIYDEDLVCARSFKDSVNLKKEWLLERFKEGLKFKILKIDGRSWGLIEYIPAEYAWTPVIAPGYMMINCFWVIGKYKKRGFGSLLLNECIKDSKGFSKDSETGSNINKQAVAKQVYSDAERSRGVNLLMKTEASTSLNLQICFHATACKAKYRGDTIQQPDKSLIGSKNGIIILAAGKVQIPKKNFFLHKGFETCDIAAENSLSGKIELLVKRFNNSPLPKFTENAKKGIIKNKNGFTFIYTDECPYVHNHLNDMVSAVEFYGIPVEVKKIESRAESQKSASPYNNISIFYNGKFLMHGIRKPDFGKFLEKVGDQGVEE
jgi:hypothetical protein